MTKKPIKFYALALLAMLLCCGVFACDATSGGNSGSAIGSVVAREESYTIAEDGKKVLTACYDVEPVEGGASLSKSQKECTYESSNTDVVKIDGKYAVAVAAGESVITVTSVEDNTKSCTFKIIVKKEVFDRALTFFGDDDFSNEWDPEKGTGSFRTVSKQSNYYYVKGINSTKWYIESEIEVHGVGINPKTNDNERWPKVGIIASARNSAGVESMVAVYLNATIGINDSYDADGNLIKGTDDNYWDEFGICEVNNTHWAWEKNIDDSTARHLDYAGKINSSITFGTKFKLGLLRNDKEFHVFVNGIYSFSLKLADGMTIMQESDGTVLTSNVGFWQFNTDATFSNYSFTIDESSVNAKLGTFSPVYITEFQADSNEA